jgi:hypothetical protein
VKRAAGCGLPRLGLFLLISLVFAGMAGPSDAACPPPPHHAPRLLVHLVAGVSRSPCARLPRPPACSPTFTTVNAAGLLAPNEYIAYIVLSRADRERGVASVTFGLVYDGAPESGVEIDGWGHCGDAAIAGTGWPASVGSAYGPTLTVFWSGNECQSKPMPADSSLTEVVVGWLRVRAVTDDHLRLFFARYPEMSDCGGTTTLFSVEDIGSARFTAEGQWSGHIPCDRGSPGSRPGCDLTGPATVAPGAEVEYQAHGLCCGVRYTRWSVAGAATMVGSQSGHPLRVVAGEGGTFEVTFVWTGDRAGGCCSRTITIDPSLPVVPTTWGRIKALVR